MIPSNHRLMMTEDQHEALAKLETFGWRLHIVRRPKFEPTEVVLEHSGGQYALLTKAGELEHQAPPPMRRKEPEPAPPEEPVDSYDPWANANDEGAMELQDAPAARVPATGSKEPVPTQTGNGKRAPKILV